MRIVDQPQNETIDAAFEDMFFLGDGVVVPSEGDGVEVQNSLLKIYTTILAPDGNGIASGQPGTNDIFVATTGVVAGYGSEFVDRERYGTGISVEDLDLENFGLITGIRFGVNVLGGVGEIINSGIIEGQVGIGTEYVEDLTINNSRSGQILGDVKVGTGIHALNGDIHVENSGEISGGEIGLVAGQGLILNDGVIRGGEASVRVLRGEGLRIENSGTLGGDVEFGGGNDIYVGRGGIALGQVFGGAGDDSLVAGAAGEAFIAGNGDDSLHGGRGEDLLNGNRGADQIIGRRGEDTLNGGIGPDVIIGGPGNDDINGGRGRDTFVFERRDGFDTIGFQRIDTLDISDFGFRGFRRDVEPRLERDGPDTLLDLGNGDGVRLEGIRPAQLDADNFIV